MESLTAAARRLYVLTEDGQVKGATYNQQKADSWMNLGDMFDYIPVVPEDIADPGEAPETRKEAPAKAMERSQSILEEQDRVQKRLDRLNRRFKRKSFLLQP
jgi:hypothetical protein